MDRVTRERRTSRRMFSVAATFGLVVGALAITASSASATYPGKNGRIAFYANKGDNPMTWIFSISQWGTHLRQLTDTLDPTALHEDWCGLLSWTNLTAHLGNHVYQARPVQAGLLSGPQAPALRTGLWEPILILASVTVLSLGIVRWRVRSVEAGE